jgi:hypothetical protein
MEDRSRNNILNGGRRLSLMTVNSSIMDNSADLLFDYFLHNNCHSVINKTHPCLPFTYFISWMNFFTDMKFR